MKLNFTKMNGAGNDFIMIDNRHGLLALSSSQIAKLCDRHRGIGADGLLAVESGETTAYRMRYYNADGREAEMCGNGARCFTRYVARLSEQQSGSVSFQTEAGILSGELLADHVRLMMSDPHSIQLGQSIQLCDQEYEVHSINTGVPHAVIFIKDLKEAPIVQVGRGLRYHPRFAPAGTNVNFVQILGPASLAIRTYERGVEDETLACGTGIVASALVHHLILKTPGPISVLAHGGDRLQVDFLSQHIDKLEPVCTFAEADEGQGADGAQKLSVHGVLDASSTGATKPVAASVECEGRFTSSMKKVTLTGPADFVFEGTINL